MSLRLRVILGVVSVVALAATSACGGSDSKNTSSGTASNPSTRLSSPSAPLTDVTVPCTKFEGVAQKIAEAESKIYSGTSSVDALQALATELDVVKDGAPQAVKDAVDELLSAFQTAKDMVTSSSAADRAKLESMAAKLSADGQTITNYVVQKCTS